MRPAGSILPRPNLQYDLTFYLVNFFLNATDKKFRTKCYSKLAAYAKPLKNKIIIVIRVVMGALNLLFIKLKKIYLADFRAESSNFFNRPKMPRL